MKELKNTYTVLVETLKGAMGIDRMMILKWILKRLSVDLIELVHDKTQ
jgi:hypothetical protein